MPPSASRRVHLAKDSARERAFRNTIGSSRVTMPKKTSPKCIHARRERERHVMRYINYHVNYACQVLSTCTTTPSNGSNIYLSLLRNESPCWINADSMQILIVYNDNVFYRCRVVFIDATEFPTLYKRNSDIASQTLVSGGQLSSRKRDLPH